MFSLSIKLSNFLRFLNDKKNIWWNLAQRSLNRLHSYYEESQDYDQSRTYYQQNVDNVNQLSDQYDFQNNQWKFANFYRFQFLYQNEFANQLYQSRLIQTQSEKQLKLSKRLQITIDSSSEFASLKLNFFRSNENIIFRFNQPEQNQEKYERSDWFFESI